MGVVKNWFAQFGHGTLKIDCISRMNILNELIFCMPVQILKSLKLFQWFLVRPTSYSTLTFKCQSTAVVLAIPMVVAGRVLWNRVSTSCHLSRCFLGIGLLDFSEFQHGVRNRYETVCDSQILWENFLCPQKLGKWAKIRVFWIQKKIWSLIFTEVFL